MTLTMPMATWDTINTLCFNRKVMMIGVDGGQDVATIAQIATIVAVYTSVDIANVDAMVAAVDEVAKVIAERFLTGRVLLHNVAAPLGITGYHPGAFDVVVFNPHAAGSPDPAADALWISDNAAKMIVVGDGAPELWDEITGGLTDGTYTASSDKTAIYITRGAPTPIVRQD